MEMEYVEKPQTVQAMLFDGDVSALMEVVQWIQDAGYVWFDSFTPAPENGITMHPSTGFLGISTAEGLMFAQKGDYIVKDPAGHIRPMSAALFGATYEEVPAPETPADPSSPSGDAPGQEKKSG